MLLIIKEDDDGYISFYQPYGSATDVANNTTRHGDNYGRTAITLTMLFNLYDTVYGKIRPR